MPREHFLLNTYNPPVVLEISKLQLGNNNFHYEGRVQLEKAKRRDGLAKLNRILKVINLIKL